MAQEPTIESLDAFSALHAHLIEWAFAQAKCAQWALPVEDFANTLRRSTEKRFQGRRASADEIEDYVKSLHLEDLGLACACGEGLEAAWEFFVRQYRQPLYGAAKAILQGSREYDEPRARELADSLYAELYGINSAGSSRRASLFHYFHGRSKLSTWLRAVLAQRYVDQIRTAKRAISLDSEEDGSPLQTLQSSAPPPADPDRKTCLERLDAALSAALQRLAPREKLVLAYYYLDQLTLREIGRALGEHESTISRQLDRTRRELREAVTQSLLRGTPESDGRPAEQGFDRAQLELAFECALEDWPFDLSRTISSEGRTSKRDG
jgi:RNA polymerase sigma-70 factor